jgi:hypothetical protein
VTAPALAQTSPDGHRVYVWQGRAYPSVTAILAGGVPKPFLPAWAARTAAEYAVAHLDRLRLLPARAAVAEVKHAPWTQRDTAAGLGDAVHAAVEAAASGRPRPDLPAAAVPYLAAFDRFCADHGPGWLVSEQTVVSRRYGYAGTLDALCTLGNRVTLLDVKTGRGVYPEAALQLAAYAHADFASHPDGRTEQPLPAIQAGAVLHLRPGGYQLVPVPIGQAVLEAFLAARAVFCWATELAPAVLPAPTTGPRPGGGHP